MVLGGTDGKHLSSDSRLTIDPEFPAFKSEKSVHPMTVHVFDIDSLSWSTLVCKNAGTGAQPSPRAYHSATLLGKNLFVTGGQLQNWLLSNSHYIHVSGIRGRGQDWFVHGRIPLEKSIRTSGGRQIPRPHLCRG